MNKALEQGKIYIFIKDYCYKNGFKFKDRDSINRYKDKPYDSVDRFIALYMLENEKQLIEDKLPELSCKEDLSKWYKSINKDFIEEFELVETWSYNNYEREGISNEESLYIIIREAKKGNVLNNSYYIGDGWFGAS